MLTPQTRKEREAQAYREREAARRDRQKPKRQRRDIADRETQHARYIDCGPQAWDDQPEDR